MLRRLLSLRQRPPAPPDPASPYRQQPHDADAEALEIIERAEAMMALLKLRCRVLERQLHGHGEVPIDAPVLEHLQLALEVLDRLGRGEAPPNWNTLEYRAIAGSLRDLLAYGGG